MATHFSEDNFDLEVLQSTLPVLVDFYADWCGPCKMLGPVIDELAKEYDGKVKIGKVNVDDAGSIAGNYGVMSIPTLIFFKGGEIVDQAVGFLPKEELKRKLDALV